VTENSRAAHGAILGGISIILFLATIHVLDVALGGSSIFSDPDAFVPLLLLLVVMAPAAGAGMAMDYLPGEGAA
jgi:hypothetical protein